MAVNCGVRFGVCRVRITRVDAAGNVIAGANSYVTDKVSVITRTPNIDTGTTFSQRNGCGCSLARFKAPDVFNWWEFALTDPGAEPVMEAFMLGADLIEDGGDGVGVAYPAALSCSDDEPAVALEYWVEHIVGSAQDAQFPWIHHVYPMTIWQVGNEESSEGIATPVWNSFSRTNENWGDGPYGDGPPDGADIAEGAWWKTDVSPPDAECAAQNVTSSS